MQHNRPAAKVPLAHPHSQRGVQIVSMSWKPSDQLFHELTSLAKLPSARSRKYLSRGLQDGGVLAHMTTAGWEVRLRHPPILGFKVLPKVRVNGAQH